MKQTIEYNGYTIILDMTDNTIKASCEKDGDVIEEFNIDIEEGTAQSQAQENMDDIQGQAEPDFDDNSVQHEDEDTEPELESYSVFLERKRAEAQGKKK